MWHEARKQEKRIRGMMVDLRKRAERRREYYERIKQDPAQFLQLHGRQCRIHIDPAIAQAADSPTTMMPWQGRADNIIDRFDVRAHLDVIPEYKSSDNLIRHVLGDVAEEPQANYERYRVLVQNEFFGIKEDKFLYQIYMEERFGPVTRPGAEEEKKKLAEKKAAIGYTYEDSTHPPFRKDKYSQNREFVKPMKEESEDDEEEDLSDIDFDVSVDVEQLTIEQSSEMNSYGLKYGMGQKDFISFLHQDKDEADQLKVARELEEEKAMYSGRKSRRERRALREKKLQGRRVTSPPSYAAREEVDTSNKPYSEPRSVSRSKSRSLSPAAAQIQFITSFGGDASDEESKGRENPANAKLLTGQNSEVHLRTASVSGPDLPRTRRTSHSSSSSFSDNKGKKKSTGSAGGGGGSGGAGDAKRHRSSSSSSSSRSSSSSGSSSSRRGGSRNEKRRRGRNGDHTRYSQNRRSSRHSKSQSRSRSSDSRSSSTSGRSSRSRSPSRGQSGGTGVNKKALTPPPVKSYYRHSLSRSNSEIDSLSSDDEETNNKSDSSQNILAARKTALLFGKAEPSSKPIFTPQERLKRKMQALLNKQYKADKKAAAQKQEKQEQERMDRAEELREMAIKLRQRERERRHRMMDYDRDSAESCAGDQDELVSSPPRDMDQHQPSAALQIQYQQQQDAAMHFQQTAIEGRSSTVARQQHKSRSPRPRSRSPVPRTRNSPPRSRSPGRRSRSPHPRSRSPRPRSGSPSTSGSKRGSRRSPFHQLHVEREGRTRRYDDRGFDFRYEGRSSGGYDDGSRMYESSRSYDSSRSHDGSRSYDGSRNYEGSKAFDGSRGYDGTFRDYDSRHESSRSHERWEDKHYSSPPSSSTSWHRSRQQDVRNNSRRRSRSGSRPRIRNSSSSSRQPHLVDY